MIPQRRRRPNIPAYARQQVSSYYASGVNLNRVTCRAVSDTAHLDKPFAVAAMNAEGIAVESSAQALNIASASSSDVIVKNSIYPTSFPILPQHVFYDDSKLLAGLSRCPTMPGHTLAILKHASTNIFSLQRDDFVQTMLRIRELGGILRKFYKVGRCALVTEGDSSITLLPLHGLKDSWEPVTSNLKEFNDTYPGYISSKDGPPMDSARLFQICSQIQKVSDISKPFNYTFDGDESDQNLFARIIRGELPQSRIWEDDRHVAFLTPFANTPGFSVLTPRAHLSSDILSLDESSYTEMVTAAYAVANILKSAFEIPRCGMIFEGFEVDFAHIKLIPIHESSAAIDSISTSGPANKVAYEEKYQGYVTSCQGPLAQDLESLSENTLLIRQSTQGTGILSPRF